LEQEELPVFKYSVQLYYAPMKLHGDDDHPPLQIASGVLIKYKSKFYLTTCKHVFDTILPSDVIIFTEGGFAVRLPNKATFLSGKRDSIDLALIRLSTLRVRELKRQYFFLPSRNIGFNHLFSEELSYMLLGFVSSKTKRDQYVFYSMSFGFLTVLKNFKQPEKLGVDYKSNITLEYNRRKMYELDFSDDVRVLGYKDLTGLSGGGVWLSTAGKKPHTFDYILVAIMTQQRINRGFVVATKVDLIQSMI
jgi:hypothetical protein